MLKIKYLPIVVIRNVAMIIWHYGKNIYIVPETYLWGYCTLILLNNKIMPFVILNTTCFFLTFQISLSDLKKN